MNYIQIDKASISNGTGVRVVLWCAGCHFHCKGCFNPETWDYNAGKEFDNNAKEYLFKQLSKPYIQGITFSGGHPLEPTNIECVRELIIEIKEKFPDKDIWLYTGYNLDFIDEFLEGFCTEWVEVISMCDVVVDGCFDLYLKDITLPFRGSANQRVIDVKETIKQNKIVERFR